MKKIIKYSFFVLLIGIAYIVFIPQQYDVPAFQPLDGMAYWKLTTGSTIGYKLLAAKGDKKQVPILYLHGGPGGAISQNKIEMLQPFAEKGYDVYLYDQIGGGHSERLDDISEYTVERHKEDLEAITKMIGAEEVILIAQSWGAMLATFFVADHPNKVAKIVLTGPGPILPVNRSSANEVPPDSLKIRAPLVSNREGNKRVYGARSKLIRWWALVFGTKLATDKEVDLFFSYLNRALSKSTLCDTTAMEASGGGGGYYAHIMTVKSFNQVENPREKLQKLQTDVLIMRGQCDNQKWGYAKEYLDYFQHSKLVIIPDAGHNIYAEQPDLYLEKISRFLEEENKNG